MSLRRSMSLSLALSLPALAVLALTGCSDLPTQVSGESPSGTAPMNVTDLEEPGTGGEQGGSTAMSVSEYIDGDVGGVVQLGSWRVTIPPRAMRGEGTVTLTVADLASLVCELRVEPAQLNDFRKPAILEHFNHNKDEVLGERMYSQNEAGGWDEIPSRPDPNEMSREAAIFHFSTYGSGPNKP